jgi:hypothetical protein
VITACVDRFAELGFRRFLHLLQDDGRDLLRRVTLAVDLHPGVAILPLTILYGTSFLSFSTIGSSKRRPISRLIANSVSGRVGDALTLGRQADKALAVVREGDHGRGRIGAFGVLDDLCILAVHDGDAGIGCAKVDTDYFCHVILSLKQAVGTPIRHS